MKKEALVRKGHKKVAEITKAWGYWSTDCIETENGYEVDYEKSCAGVVIDCFTVLFNKNWKAVEVK